MAWAIVAFLFGIGIPIAFFGWVMWDYYKRS